MHFNSMAIGVRIGPCGIRCVFAVVIGHGSEISTPGNPGVGNHIANVGHAGDVGNQPFKPKAETRMWNRTIASQIEVPVILAGIQPRFCYTFRQHVIAFFALRAADDFTDSGRQNVQSTYCSIIIIKSHVERFDFFRIILDDYR